MQRSSTLRKQSAGSPMPIHNTSWMAPSMAVLRFHSTLKGCPMRHLNPTLSAVSFHSKKCLRRGHLDLSCRPIMTLREQASTTTSPTTCTTWVDFGTQRFEPIPLIPIFRRWCQRSANLETMAASRKPRLHDGPVADSLYPRRLSAQTCHRGPRPIPQEVNLRETYQNKSQHLKRPDLL